MKSQQQSGILTSGRKQRVLQEKKGGFHRQKRKLMASVGEESGFSGGIEEQGIRQRGLGPPNPVPSGHRGISSLSQQKKRRERKPGYKRTGENDRSSNL